MEVRWCWIVRQEKYLAEVNNNKISSANFLEAYVSHNVYGEVRNNTGSYVLIRRNFTNRLKKVLFRLIMNVIV